MSDCVRAHPRGHGQRRHDVGERVEVGALLCEPLHQPHVVAVHRAQEILCGGKEGGGGGGGGVRGS